MAIDRVELPSFSNVAANSTAVVNIPIGPTYGKINLVRGGTTFNAEHMTEIRLKINGKVVRTYRSRSGGHELDDINAFFGRAATANYSTLFFAKPELDSIAQERVLALGTGGGDVRTVTLEVDIGAATAPTLEAHAEIIGAGEPLGVFEHVYRFPVSSAVAGEVEYPDLPREAYSAIHFLKADISRVEVEVDRNVRYEADKTDGEVDQKHRGRTPQTANYTHVDFCGDGDIYSVMRAQQAQDFRVRPTFGTSGALVMLTEIVRGL